LRSLWLLPVLHGALVAGVVPEFAGDRILIQPKPGISPEAMAAFHAGHSSRVLRTFDGLGHLQVVTVPQGETVPSWVAKYQQSGLVEFAEPDYLVRAALTPNDPAYTNGTCWGLNKIEAPAAWNVLCGATNVVVAVLDSGVRYTHEDLAANMWVNPLAGSHGWNAIAGTNDPWDDSTDGHGTQMAGVLGAVGNNSKGLAGVAWSVQIMACKCLNSSDLGTNSDIITCMEFARTNGARVFNASFSAVGGAFSSAMSNAIYSARMAGIILVTCAGNNYPTVNIDVTPAYPANYQIDNIVTLAYTTSSDTLGVLSNYGATNVDLAAPGDQIYSTYNTSDSAYNGSIYHNLAGTSYAAAYTSGAFALMLAEYPNEDYRHIINRVLSAVDPVPALNGKCRTGGRLNLRKALTPVLLTGNSAGNNAPFQLQVTATTNLTCVVQASADLNAWSPVVTNTTSAGPNTTVGTFSFTDYQSTNEARQFYRAVVSP